MPRLSDGMPGRRELRGAFRNGEKRHRAARCPGWCRAQVLARSHAGVLVHAPFGAADGGPGAAMVSAQRSRSVGAAHRSDAAAATGTAAARTSDSADREEVFEFFDRGARDTVG